MSRHYVNALDFVRSEINGMTKCAFEKRGGGIKDALKSGGSKLKNRFAEHFANYATEHPLPDDAGTLRRYGELAKGLTYGGLRTAGDVVGYGLRKTPRSVIYGSLGTATGVGTAAAIYSLLGLNDKMKKNRLLRSLLGIGGGAAAAYFGSPYIKDYASKLHEKYNAEGNDNE